MKRIHLAAATVLAAALGAAPSLARAQNAAEQPVKKFALELGPVLGLNIATNSLGVGPNLGLEVGGRLALGPGALAFAVRGAWEHYGMDGSGAAPCSPAGSGGSQSNPAPSSPCISSPPDGSYHYSLAEDTVTLAVPITYRLMSPARSFTPYIGVAPELVLQQEQVTTYGLTTKETATQFGIMGLLGVQLRLGPGGLFFEAGYRYAALTHRATGNAQLSTIALALGYRFSF